MTEATNSRRKFLTKGAVLVAGGAALAACDTSTTEKEATTPAVSTKAEPVVLKVQAAWGGGIFLEFAQDYVDRVR